MAADSPPADSPSPDEGFEILKDDSKRQKQDRRVDNVRNNRSPALSCSNSPLALMLADLFGLSEVMLPCEDQD